MSRESYGISGDVFASQPLTGSAEQEIAIIERRVGDFVAAWNRHEPAQMASVWHDDGDLIDPFGRIAKGRQQVQALFRDDQSGVMKTSTNQIAIASVRLLSSDLAVVDGQSTLTGMRDPAGRELPPFTPHVFMVVCKREGDWRILCARPYIFSSRPGAAS